MNKNAINAFEKIFEKLVEYANEKKNNQNINLGNKDKSIEFIYKIISQYCFSKNIILSRSYLNAYVHVIYNTKQYGEKIYRIFCPWCSDSAFYIPNNVNNIECPIVKFEDVINFYKEEKKKEQLNNIKIEIEELLEEGLTKEEIETQIKKILYKEKENPKQLVKTLEK